MSATDDSSRGDFEAMWAAYYSDVLAYARRRFDEEDARDVAAETFLVAWRRRDAIPPSRELPWLYAVARRVAGDRRRSERRAARLERALREALTHGAPSAAPDSHLLLEALARLAEEDRELLLLIAWEGLSPAEAAQVFGCSAPTVRVRLHRARRRLGRLMVEDGPTHVGAVGERKHE